MEGAPALRGFVPHQNAASANRLFQFILESVERIEYATVSGQTIVP